MFVYMCNRFFKKHLIHMCSHIICYSPDPILHCEMGTRPRCGGTEQFSPTTRHFNSRITFAFRIPYERKKPQYD